MAVPDNAIIIGPCPLSRIVLCSADASPNSQREYDVEAGYFFPGAKWVGTLRNASNKLGCRFVILTTGHGMVNPDDVISPYDLPIEKGLNDVSTNWRQTIPGLLGSSSYDILVFYSGGCPRDHYVQLLRPILMDLGMSLFTYGRPNMFDVGKTVDIVQLLVRGVSFEEIKSLLKCPDKAEYYHSV